MVYRGSQHVLAWWLSAVHQDERAEMRAFLRRRLFEQPLVPVLSAEDGAWLLPEPLAPMMKPGGHGAIWKLMLDQGIFAWLARKRRDAAIVRQIRWAWYSSKFGHAAHLANQEVAVPQSTLVALM